MLNEEINWLARRRRGIGGSDIAAIIGIDRFRTPLDVYLSKVNNEEQIESEEMESGRILENTIISWYRDKIKKENIYYEPPKSIMPYKHHKYDFMLATPDRLVYDKTITFEDMNNKSDEEIVKIAKGIAEVKNTSIRVEEPFDSWICQIQWYMNILGKEQGEIVWLSSGTKLKYKEIELNPKLISILEEAAIEFWEKHILTQIPPEPVSKEDLKKVYRQSVEGKTVEANPLIYETAAKIKKLRDEINDKSQELDELETIIKFYMKDAEALTYNGDLLFTYKTTKPTKIFNSKLFQEKYPDLYNEFLIDKEGYRKFLIKF